MKTWEILAGLGFDKLLTMIIVNVHGPAIVINVLKKTFLRFAGPVIFCP